ncbi:YesL family protein [Pullulanibacillus sp. KACC 23026]|uniref:YesL family protein n=1 Tax=Pullulanibacillus sp. KACC 23026 TaxID=3028315 RepID=UPI0023B02AE3|nr:YesL family protein [Pullulanibacillus sp. KACC 23026]WEG11875.1 YesL family protein [Pullulanibacillus sp. KACC 23026]
MSNKKEFGSGPFFTITNHIYGFLLTSVSFIVCNCLLLFVSLVIKPVFSNMIFYFLALIPTGPALSALIYSIRKLMKEKEIAPIKLYFYGYKRNLKDASKLWIPFLVISFVLVADLQYFNRHSSVMNSVLEIVFVMALFFLAVAVFYGLLISSQFVFRTKDLLKLSILYLLTKVKCTLGNIALIIILLFLSMITSNLVVILFSSLICYAFLLNSQVILKDVEENYIQSSQ